MVSSWISCPQMQRRPGSLCLCLCLCLEIANTNTKFLCFFFQFVFFHKLCVCDLCLCFGSTLLSYTPETQRQTTGLCSGDSRQLQTQTLCLRFENTNTNRKHKHKPQTSRIGDTVLHLSCEERIINFHSFLSYQESFFHTRPSTIVGQSTDTSH